MKKKMGSKNCKTLNFNFESYKKNIFSQYGEDGIIAEIFYRLKEVSDKKCCEFGAWDGKYLSNTCNLITNHNYEAILIEADQSKFDQLNINFPSKKIIKVNKFVNFSGENSLDNILKKNFFNKDFDFLSIDIDGCDYWIFKSLSKFTPKVICIEFNPSIPNKIEFVQEKNLKIKQGSSAKSIINLGLKKNYFPIASTYCNIFLIHNRFKKFVTIENKFDIDKLLPNSNDNYIYCGYDGTVFTSKPLSLWWHKIMVQEIKILPKILNMFPKDYNTFQKIIFILFNFYLNPIKYLSKPEYYLKKLFSKFLRHIKKKKTAK
jgi:hypothetical protein